MNKSIKKVKSCAGFTLIELLIYISISTAAILVFTSFMVDVTKSAARAKSTKEVQQNARLLLERLTQDIRTARSIDSAGVNQIVLFDASNIKVQYCLTDTDKIVHYLKGEGDCFISTSELSSDQVRVTKLDFQQNSGTVKVDLTVQQKNQNPSTSEKSQISLSSTIVPRSSIY